MLSPRPLRIRLVAGMLAIILFLGTGELLVRMLLPYNTPETIRRNSLQYVPSLFSRHRLKPLGETVEEDSDKGLGKKSADLESGQRFFINDIGYRGPHFVPRKPQGVVRIIVVGGSTVFDANAKDHGPTDAGDWPHLIERLLKRQGFTAVEVINAGVPGHATFDSLGRLYSQLWIYEPDYVVLYNAWNDIKYFSGLTPERPLISLYEPLSPGSNPFTDYQSPLDRFLANSQLYVKLRNLYYSRIFRVGDEGAMPSGQLLDIYGSWGVQQYRLNVELFVTACQSIGATPILVTEATLVTAANSVEEQRRIPYAYFGLTHSALVRAFEEVYGTLRSIAHKSNVPFVDLTKEVNGKAEFFSDAVHLTSEGSKMVATLLSNSLATSLQSRGASVKESVGR